MVTRFAVLTNTLAEGYVNCWLDNDDNPLTFSTRAQAERELKEYYEDNHDALADGLIMDFERNLIVCEVDDD